MLASQQTFLTSLPLNQTMAADALDQMAKDFNGTILVDDHGMAYTLRYGILCAAANGYARLVFQCIINLEKGGSGVTELGLDIAITHSQGSMVAIVAEEPLRSILASRGVEVGSFRLGTTEAHYIHPNIAFQEAQSLGWTTSITTVGYPENGWFDIRRGEVDQSPYPFPVLVLDPRPVPLWKKMRFPAIVLAVGVLSMWVSGSKTLPIVLMTLLLFAYAHSPWVRTLVLGGGVLSILYFWME